MLLEKDNFEWFAAGQPSIKIGVRHPPNYRQPRLREKEMAQLFIKQAKQYLAARPSYPVELFEFIASKTPSRELVWDVGTGSGQAALPLAKLYKNVIATDTSQKQLDLAPKLPNIRYHCTSPDISMSDLEQNITTKSTLDLVTIAQALHWFNLPTFYHQVKHILKKPNGVIAAWCYTTPKVNATFDSVLDEFYTVDSGPYWDQARKLVDDEYRSVDFPFEPVDGTDTTGPFKFVTEKVMGLDDFVMYLKSWSAYQTAKEKGVELLGDDVIEKFKGAWNKDNEDGDGVKVVKFPVYLRIGKVGDY